MDDEAALVARLKERVYVTFGALAVVLALRAHHESATEAAFTLAIAALGTVLAVFLADVMAHVVVHAALPDRAELAHAAQVSFGALGAVVLPLVFLGLAIADVWHVEAALRASSIALVAALVAIGYLAVRRVALPAWQKLIVLFAEFVLGTVVIGLELFAHG